MKELKLFIGKDALGDELGLKDCEFVIGDVKNDDFGLELTLYTNDDVELKDKYKASDYTSQCNILLRQQVFKKKESMTKDEYESIKDTEARLGVCKDFETKEYAKQVNSLESFMKDLNEQLKVIDLLSQQDKPVDEEQFGMCVDKDGILKYWDNIKSEFKAFESLNSEQQDKPVEKEEVNCEMGSDYFTKEDLSNLLSVLFKNTFK